jgi:hypothetical protein
MPFNPAVEMSDRVGANNPAQFIIRKALSRSLSRLKAVTWNRQLSFNRVYYRSPAKRRD